MAHLFIKMLVGRLGSQHVEMTLDDICIVSNSRARLSLKGSELLKLGGRLSNKGQHDTERKALLLQQLTRHIVAIVAEIACEDGSKMKRLALLTGQPMYLTGDTKCQILQSQVVSIIQNLKEGWHYREIGLSIPRKGLHGVEHPRMRHGESGKWH